MSIGVILLLASQQQIFKHYLWNRISEHNFAYQTPPYIQRSFEYYKTEKQMNDQGQLVIQKLARLDKGSDIKAIRDAIGSCYRAKESGLGKEWRRKITEFFENYFETFPEKAKSLSRQDVCTLILVDNEFAIEIDSKDSLKPLLSGFRSLIKKDFDDCDVAIAYLRLSSSSYMPQDAWDIERQDWSLATANRIDPMGIICVGVRTWREVAQANRRRDPKLTDHALSILDRARKVAYLADTRAGFDSTYRYLTRQKVLLLELMKKEKGKKSGK